MGTTFGSLFRHIVAATFFMIVIGLVILSIYNFFALKLYDILFRTVDFLGLNRACKYLLSTYWVPNVVSNEHHRRLALGRYRWPIHHPWSRLVQEQIIFNWTSFLVFLPCWLLGSRQEIKVTSWCFIEKMMIWDHFWHFATRCSAHIQWWVFMQ